MVTYVYDFAQGNKDEKDLLGGKGANLAEMTNLGLPVPPGFTISTEACRAYLAEGREPDGLADEISAHLKSLEEAMGRSLGAPGDPLLVSVRSGREVLDARDDGDRPQRRPQRRVGAGPGLQQRQPAVRPRLLPPPAADVRRHGAGHRGRAVPRRPRRPEEGPRHDGRHRPRRRGPPGADRDLQGDHREGGRPPVPPGAARAARPRRTRRLRLLEHRPRRALPPSGADPRGPRDRRQRAGHGLRQLRRRLRLGRLLHPRPRQRRPGRVRRLPPERPGRGRRGGHPQHRLARRHGRDRQGLARRAARRSCPSSSTTTRTCATSSSPSSAASSGCCRPASASARPRRRSGSRCTWPTRA